MKNKLLSLGLLLLSSSLVCGVLTSCNRHKKDEEPPIIDPDPPTPIPPDPPIPPEPVYTTLKAPVLSLDKSTGVVSWEAIEKATSYLYYVNNGDFISTTNTSVTLSEGQSVSVMADSTDEYTYASSWSNPISFVNIDETYKYATISFVNVPNMNSISHPKGEPLSLTTTPTNDQYIFDGWYKDPFYKEAFSDGEVIFNDLKLYAKWITPTYLDAYFFVKCNSLLTNNEKGYKNEDTSSTAWGFIPLHYDAQLSSSLGNRKSYSAILTTTSGTSASNPAQYIIMDGIDDEQGRHYWKDANDADFSITSEGTWKLSFSIEYEWENQSQKVHAHIDSYASQTYSLNKINSYDKTDLLDTPNVTLNKEESKVSWPAVSGAKSYQYSINNGELMETNATEVNLYLGQYVIVRAVSDNANLSSKWTMPIVNNYEAPVTSDACYVTFFNSEIPGLKVNKGDVINNPGNPTKIGYTFGGWYKDINYKETFDFATPISRNTVVYAKWDLVTSSNRYFLMSPKGQKVVELHLNQAQTTFNEYYAIFTVGSGEDGVYTIIDSLDNNKVLYTHLIDDLNCEYQVCFSFDHMYDSNKFCAINHTRYNLYFTNTLDTNHDVYAHYWSNSVSNRGTSWPGTKMTWVKKNSYNQDIWMISLYKNYYEYIIFNNHGNGKQTVDISLANVKDGTQWYLNGEQDGSGHYKVSSTTFVD